MLVLYIIFSFSSLSVTLSVVQGPLSRRFGGLQNCDFRRIFLICSFRVRSEWTKDPCQYSTSFLFSVFWAAMLRSLESSRVVFEYFVMISLADAPTSKRLSTFMLCWYPDHFSCHYKRTMFELILKACILLLSFIWKHSLYTPGRTVKEKYGWRSQSIPHSLWNQCWHRFHNRLAHLICFQDPSYVQWWTQNRLHKQVW